MTNLFGGFRACCCVDGECKVVLAVFLAAVALAFAGQERLHFTPDGCVLNKVPLQAGVAESRKVHSYHLYKK